MKNVQNTHTYRDTQSQTTDHSKAINLKTGSIIFEMVCNKSIKIVVLLFCSAAKSHRCVGQAKEREKKKYQ